MLYSHNTMATFITGDSLTIQKCVELIASLSKCEFCFICAHDRPSIAPLINIERDYAHEEVDVKCMARNTLSFGPKRVIRR